jgi:iron complex outermembrane receptor protein
MKSPVLCQVALTIAFSALNTFVSTANAQTAAQPASTALNDTSGQQGLQEIVVTAQKRSENLQQAPVAVTALTASDLSAGNVLDEDGLQSFVPGLQVTHGGLNAVVFLRGIGNNSGTPGNEPAVSTYVDGVYHPSPVGSVFSFNNVEQIEVLKGPQGTLFGRNAAGGVINITTKDPTSDPTMRVDVGYGNLDTISANSYLSAGVRDNLAADFAVNYSHQGDGWGRNVYNGNEAYLTSTFDVRSKWVFTPSNTTKITFVADYDASRDDQGANYAVVPGTLTNTGIAHAGGFYDVSSEFDPSNHDDQLGLAATIVQDFNWARLTSITSWRTTHGTMYQNVDATSLPTIKFTTFQKERTTTQELNLQAAPESRIKWIGGLYYFGDNGMYDPYIQSGTTFGSPTGGVSTTASQQTYSYAGYGQVTSPLWDDDTHLTTGIRYTDDKRTPSASRVSYPSDAPRTLVYPANYPFNSRADRVTYKVSLDHSFARDFMTYVSVSTGFKSGNYNLSNITQVPTSAETLTAYEIGEKSEWFDHRLRLNLAAYHYDFDNLQVQAITTAGTVQTNAAASKFNGADAEVVLAPLTGLQITGSLNYTESKYSSYPNAVCTYPLATGGFGPGQVCNVTGNKVALVDPLSASTSVQYSKPIPRGVISGEANVSYQHGFYFDAQNSIKQDPYALFGASLTWTSPAKTWDVTLFGKNLSNAQYYANRTLTPSLGDSYTVAPPRTYGARVGFKY